MKAYLASTYSATATVTSVAYVIIFSIALMMLCRRTRLVDGYWLVVLALFWCRVVFVYVAPLTSVFPNLPDTLLYSEIISAGAVSESQSIGLRLYATFIYPISVLLGSDPLIFGVFQVFVLFLSMFFVAATIKLILVSNGKAYDPGNGIVAFLAFSIYPASIVFVSVPLREYLTSLVWSMLFLGAVKRFYGKGSMLFIFASVSLLFVRPQHIIIPFITFFFLRPKRLRYMPLAILTFPVVLWFFQYFYGYSISPSFLSRVRMDWSEMHGDMVYGVFQWSSYFDLLSDLPALVAQFLMSPLPILSTANPLSHLAAFCDVLYIITLCMWIVFSGKSRLKYGYAVFVLIVPFVLLSSIWEAYLNGAVRHRIPFVIALIILLGTIYRIRSLSARFSGSESLKSSALKSSGVV